MDPYESSMFPILKFFRYSHLPEHLQAVSQPFAEMAIAIVERTGGGTKNIPEVAAGLRKLLEAKDCIVRAALS